MMLFESLSGNMAQTFFGLEIRCFADGTRERLKDGEFEVRNLTQVRKDIRCEVSEIDFSTVVAVGRAGGQNGSAHLGATFSEPLKHDSSLCLFRNIRRVSIRAYGATRPTSGAKTGRLGASPPANLLEF